MKVKPDLSFWKLWNISDTRPKIMAVLTAMPKLPALGSRHMTSTATNEPINR